MAFVFYLMGPSGSGKDSLIQGVRACMDLRQLNGHLLIAHRYITRPWQAGGENHLELTEHEFKTRAESGLFCLHWSANHCYYGIGNEIAAWLTVGHSVLLNGSRGHLQEAKLRFGDQLIPIMIKVDEGLLKNRLENRGRESQSDIQQRIERTRYFNTQLSHDANQAGFSQYHELHNNGELDKAVAELTTLIDTCRALDGHV